MKPLVRPLLLLLALVVLLGLSLRALGSQLLHDLQQTARLEQAAMLEVTLQHAFLANDFEMVQHVLASAGNNHRETVAVRLVSRDSSVLASSIPDEIGVHLNREQRQCAGCHTAGSALLASSARVKTGEGNEELFVTANRVDNHIACQQCHDGDLAGLGVILIENRVEPLDSYLAQLDRWLVAGGLAVYTLLAGGLVLGTRQRARAAPSSDAAMATGLPLAQPAKDEVAAFQQRAFHALLSIAEAVEEEPSTVRVFERALDAVREATGFDSVAMRLYEADSDCFRLLVQRGMSQAMVEELACIPASKGFQAEVARTKQPAVTSALPSDPRLGGLSVLEMGYQTLACVPLLAGRDVVGSMELASPLVYEWTPEKVRWLSLVGRTVGVFVRHAQHTSHLRDLAVLKERSFIAQEIHDGLAQLIGSIYVWAEDAQLSLEEGEVGAAQIGLKRIDRTARDAYAVLREEMLGLRDVSLPDQGLIPYLEEQLDRFQRQWGVTTHLVGGDENKASPVVIAPAAEIQLLRILQEVLTNVRRHACASSVTVTLAEEEGRLAVTVEDDGQGFDPEQVGSKQLGLSIMRDRAASVGGRFEVETEKGGGTRVRIVLPLRSHR